MSIEWCRFCLKIKAGGKYWDSLSHGLVGIGSLLICVHFYFIFFHFLVLYTFYHFLQITKFDFSWVAFFETQLDWIKKKLDWIKYRIKKRAWKIIDCVTISKEELNSIISCLFCFFFFFLVGILWQFEEPKSDLEFMPFNTMLNA